jgi:hypothetical protein
MEILTKDEIEKQRSFLSAQDKIQQECSPELLSILSSILNRLDNLEKANRDKADAERILSKKPGFFGWEGGNPFP